MSTEHDPDRLTEIHERVRRTREAQGLPPTIEDESVLDQVAELLSGPPVAIPNSN